MPAVAHSPVMVSERRAWRAMADQGMTAEAISKIAGRCPWTVRQHLEPAVRRRARAERMERFFAACNRAVAEARP